LKKLISSTFWAGIALALSAVPAVAQGTGTTLDLSPKSTTFEGLKNVTVVSIVSGLITLALIVAAVIFFFMLLIGGVQWIMSGGDKQNVENARNRITNALIGLVIVFAAWAIGALMETFFGVNIFSLTLPSLKG